MLGYLGPNISSVSGEVKLSNIWRNVWNYATLIRNIFWHRLFHDAMYIVRYSIREFWQRQYLSCFQGILVQGHFAARITSSEKFRNKLSNKEVWGKNQESRYKARFVPQIWWEMPLAAVIQIQLISPLSGCTWQKVNLSIRGLKDSISVTRLALAIAWHQIPSYQWKGNIMHSWKYCKTRSNTL